MYIFQKREMQLTLAACSDRNVNVKRITERAVVLGGKAKVSMKKSNFSKEKIQFSDRRRGSLDHERPTRSGFESSFTRFGAEF